MKEWMKEALVFTVLSMFVTVVVFQFGDLPVGGVDSEYKSRLRCALHGIPPQVQLSKVPLTLGTDWVTFDLPQNMPRAPQKEYVVLTFPHEMFTEPEPHAEGTKHQQENRLCLCPYWDCIQQFLIDQAI